MVSDVATVSDDVRERLGDRLSGLVAADDRSTFADAEELAYAEGRVRVVVELAAGANLPSSPPLDVEARHDPFVQAFVAVDDLPALARAESVRAVRPPQSPVAADLATALGPGGGT
ncbi:hypothetical protein SAMN04488124_3375 [Halogeometricum limi]|uniref:Uncharacterized protein n=2 Tax=Halogeometricum limi TaxID=555875 RepID=A0A1I6ILN8_9EURY|nr:hypothetical protein SAMN04488124_3375 [Halogeometricum limi]